MRRDVLCGLWVAAAVGLSAAAQAGERLEGDRVRVSYGDGLWNDHATGTGLQAWHDGTWSDYSYPGQPYNAWFVSWDDGGSAPEAYFADSSAPSTNAVLLDSEDLSTETMLVARHAWQVGAAQLRKTEVWSRDGSVMLVQFYLTNQDSRTFTAPRVLFGVDPDQDYAFEGNVNTINDASDTDGDGLADVATSVGPVSGHTIAFGACPGIAAEVGHYGSWTYERDLDVPLDDGEGTAADVALGIRLPAAESLAPGASATVSFLVAVGDTPEAAADHLSSGLALCDGCDSDGDGWLAPACGGQDCDDANAAVNPDATDADYDGVDGDCSGGSDYDADGDGSDVPDDCNDADPYVRPGVPDEPYDGIDADCDGASDLDGDADGYDSAGLGGDDCNDADPAIHPGATDEDGDGVDADCDGNDAPAPVEVVGKCGCASTPPATSVIAALLVAAGLSRRRRYTA
jgi:uncharacterized protein (TIGR03382 family)